MTGAAPHWSPQNQERAKRIAERYPDRRSAVMPLLYLASLEHRHVSDDAIRDVAVLTGLTSAQVNSVASFYTMYKRNEVGRYLISVCTSISCFLCGADDVLDAVESETATTDGQMSADGMFSVEHVECLGACGGAPAVQVNYELIEGVVPDTAGALVRWLRDGRPAVVLGDEMQELFGGRRSFDWAIAESEGAIAPIPAIGLYGSAGKEGR
jgi:NADH-quinone oxidoreductase subunit E